jgi:uncharacterized repeat protein (TIGR01451 family)
VIVRRVCPAHSAHSRRGPRAPTPSPTPCRALYTGPDPIQHTVTATSTTPDPALGNNTAVASTSAGSPVADLSITKTDGSATAVPGAPITYTITATNAGPSAALGANVVDNFPVDITGVTWTCAAAGGASLPGVGCGQHQRARRSAAGRQVVFTATGTISAAARSARW